MAVTANSFVTHQSYISGSATISTGLTTRTDITGTTGLTAVITTAKNVNGCVVDSIEIQPQGTTTANVVRIWKYDGTTSHLALEVGISAVTASNTTALNSYIVPLSAAGRPFYLDANWGLYASTNNTENYTVLANGGAL